MRKDIKIHDTAFMTSIFRAMNESLSNDSYSKLWNNKKTKVWVDDYLKEVSNEEVHTHCVRNRFFLEKIKERLHEVEVLINFGAGFSMYPFLLDESIIHIEIDKPDIVNNKQTQILNWISKGELPQRDIHFIGTDFSQNYEEDLYTKIKTIKKDKKSFILIEGVLFFLDMNQAKRIFNFFDKVQKTGEYIGSVSFKHTIKETKVFSRLLQFFNDRILKTSEDDYLTIDTSFYTKQPRYTIKEHKDYFMYSKELNNKINQNATDILNENFYLLQKTT
ncbi:MULTISPECIES: class I SAM-dependent methyltransferase [unclassified Tenacibaculum]|uniref:class I SAM-dependent methyltransferase n=1 Tax=unclassified Tenacibaculum TaxID=2635139 RepID=UPI001F334C78|nr:MULTISPECIES: class I SAM-dependent methyltransferase [unclassified Tenacibaculum]MCF2874284.1 class I SAM-dependent methyltransferase [Tenacibaculum sp. Cn5-1]MCF2934865.1 class I SAM-dependent methyltransferase [Tenacibaculum sp. Cn5-34]MCG7511075.1 class I SAM-dependent methyltransferase [Tenacibaculum sp. Cn5-46]